MEGSYKQNRNTCCENYVCQERQSMENILAEAEFKMARIRANEESVNLWRVPFYSKRRRPCLLLRLTAHITSACKLLAGDAQIANMTENITHPYEGGLAASWIETLQPNWQSKKSATFAICPKKMTFANKVLLPQPRRLSISRCSKR